MAKKSKTQRVKASAVRAQKKLEQEAKAQDLDEQVATTEETEKPKRTLFRKAESSEKPVVKTEEKKPVKKEEKKSAKKLRFAFFSDVRAELRRVTWPTRQDVLRWSLVVVGALVFFGVFVLVLDNFIVSPLLVAISGLGA